MTDEEKELNEKILGWVNESTTLGIATITDNGWMVNDNYEVGAGWARLAFTRSMDTCLELIVPKLKEVGLDISLDSINTKWDCCIRYKELVYLRIRERNACLALCRAVEALLDTKGTRQFCM